ncbi:MAG: metalloregulator ArsR/SmtB family transcription factor [Candidatus Omnitrophota bacterium]|nr:metalloregulator ArsR/SmtB family transcription factor [Candidatus Omnitrophota bacterium]MBU1894597.1 metalloregulator ArsR/SmtB family transcription factor [Candidatus Omnitrophota bacterium]
MRIKLLADIKKGMKRRIVIEKLSRTFSVLGDATRIRIIFVLLREELCVAELSSLLQISHSAISHQLRALKDLDLVKSRKEGKKVYYSLSDRHIENLFNEGLKHVLEKI